MFDLDGGVVGHAGEFRRQPFDDAPRVRGSVQEVRIAEADVLRARMDLRPDVIDHRVNGNRVKPPVVDRDDRAVTA